MKARHWWQVLGAACLAAGVVISLRGHAPDNGDARGNFHRQTAAGSVRELPESTGTPAASDAAPDTVPPPHEVSPAPPFGVVPPPDNDPLLPPEEMDELLKPKPAGNP